MQRKPVHRRGKLVKVLMRGLTEAEIGGIGKVDEALALKKVNPEELLELRKQQLGNVGESGSSTKLYSPVEYKGSLRRKRPREVHFQRKKNDRSMNMSRIRRSRMGLEVIVRLLRM